MPEDKHKINDTWLFWGTWSQTVLFTSVWLDFSSSEVFKKMKLDNVLKGDIKVLNGSFYFLNQDLSILYDIFTEKIEKDISWFDSFFDVCEEKTSKLLEYEKKKNLANFLLFIPELLGCSTLVEFFDFCMERSLKMLCSKHHIHLSDLMAMMHPERKTVLMQYQDDLDILSIESKNELNQFLKKYQWVGTHGFEGDSLREDQVLGVKTGVSLSKNRSNNDDIELPEVFHGYLEIGKKLVFFRSNLIESLNRASFCYWEDLKELADKNKISFEDIVSLTYYEILDFIGKPVLKKNTTMDRRNFGLEKIGMEKRVILGDDLSADIRKLRGKDNINSLKKELKGMIACKGKVQGTVRVINNVGDINKVDLGDIIVATETQPSYIMAMKKAVAFITDNGGITSHAAIIAREMQKPCIIGTKIATKVLKDGDIVEVDAEVGVVRIIK